MKYLSLCAYFLIAVLLSGCGKCADEPRRFVVKAGEYKFDLVLADSPAAAEFANALPLEISMRRWGDEYYGASPLYLKTYAAATMNMQVGHLAYWPPGQSLCIIFGSTPPSPGPTPQLYSPGVILGRLKGDLSPLRGLEPQVLVVIYETN